MPIWSDFFKLFTYSSEKDPLSKARDISKFSGAGVSQADSLMAGNDFSNNQGPNGYTNLRQTYDMIDTTSLNNRSMRYKEYERLRSVPEIETALTVFADEACVAGETLIATPFGYQSIEWLYKNKSEERFLVYCYDFEKKDYSLDWAFAPRLVKKAETIQILFDNGKKLIATTDHKILLKNGTWTECGDLGFGDELMPFYRIPAKQDLTKIKINQFPRIFSFHKGWLHERQFVDEWKTGKSNRKYEKINLTRKMIAEDIPVRKIAKTIDHDWNTLESWINNEGFSLKEIKWLSKNKLQRKVVGIAPGPEVDVYDISVDKHKCFATDSVILHNCQKDDEGNIFKIDCKNEEVKKELNFVLLHRKMLNLNRYGVIWFKNLCINGDWFVEVIINPENPSEGIYKLMPLPPETMYRIETIKGRLLEFQQAKEGPDYKAVSDRPITQYAETELSQTTAIRFAPSQIIHMRIGDDRKTFYPYGQSLIEPARGPAHSLRLMEDSMLVYRLSRATERRIFYIDVGQLPPFKAEAFIDRLKDQFRKRKIPNNRGVAGANSVEERWQPPAVDEDYWVPIRPNANTRIETLPGACLDLNTKIPLLDGTNNSLSEIIQRWNNGEEMWAYSCNPTNGKMVPGLITWAGITRRDAKVLKITFDNGKSLICTPDHKFPVIGTNGKTEAKDLKIGNSLIPFRTRLEKIKNNTNEYMQIYDSCEKQWKFVHRMVAEHLNIQETTYNSFYKNYPKKVIHHYDFNRFNNNPKNLRRMNWEDHLKLHQDAPQTPETKKKISEGLKKYHNSLTEEQKNKRDKTLIEKSKLGVEKFKNLLKTDVNFKNNFTNAQKKGWVNAVKTKPEIHKKRGEKIGKYNKIRFENQKYKSNIFDKQTIKYPDSIFESLCEGFKNGNKVDDIVKKINLCQSLINDYVSENKHIVRNVDFKNGITVCHIKRLIKNKGFKGARDLRKHLIGKINLRNNKTNQNNIYGKTTLNFPQKIFTYFIHRLAEKSCRIIDILSEINQNPGMMQEWLNANTHVKRKKVNLQDGIKPTHIDRMVKSYGYENLKHAKKEAKLYNHTIISIEYLDETQDVGTITIDGNELYHNYHTFAISDCEIMTYNSNLDQIDDSLYFRNKLFTALNFPKNYFSSEDPNATRITLSAQDVKFARMIERLQSSFEDGVLEISERHLQLRGFPEEIYEDLKIKMTPPSDWRELSRNEVVQARFGNGGTLKSSQLMADYDIYTKIFKYSESDSQEMIARLKLQKLEDLKLQVIAQNPQLLGVGIPGQENQGQEIGTEPGGPNPMLGSEEQPPEMKSTPNLDPVPEGQEQNQAPELENPSEDDIKKFDLSLQDYESEMDIEDRDASIN